MMSKKITVTIKTRQGPFEVEVQPMQLEVPGFSKTVPVWVHRVLGGGKGWQITDPETGCNLLSVAQPSGKKAVDAAMERMARIGESVYEECMARNRQQ